MKRGHYSVRPRYTPGSPALVDYRTAQRVAEQEKDSYRGDLGGYYGEELQARAEKLGLRGIVEYRVERGSGKNHGWEIEDLCTGEKLFRLTTEALEKRGWTSYEELPGWAKYRVDSAPPADFEDHKQAWYRQNLKRGESEPWFEVYRPEVRS